MQIDISLVIPIFGKVHTERLFATIDSLLLQTGVSTEIIVSEQTTGNGLFLKERFPTITHIPFPPTTTNGKEIYNAGITRNRGMQHAKGEYIYFNDADIIFFDPQYLHRLHQEVQPGEVLIRPDMWRMVKEEVPRFLELYTTQGLQSALSQVVFKENYLASFEDSDVKLELIEFKEKTFSATSHDFRQYKINPSLLGEENLLWQRIVHCGGTFGKKKDIESVGGYSSQYPVCVYEDSDLQWKLRDKFTVREINGDDRYAVLHLDHELSYRSSIQENSNNNIFELRKAKGVALAIEDDLSNI